MTVKELKDELAFYEDDDEIIFEVNDDFEPESVTEDRYGNKSVHLDSRLKVTFSGNAGGYCWFEFGVEE